MPSDTAAGVTREWPLDAPVSLFGDFGNFDVWEAQTQTSQANSGEIEECKYDPGRYELKLQHSKKSTGNYL